VNISTLQFADDARGVTEPLGDLKDWVFGGTKWCGLRDGYNVPNIDFYKTCYDYQRNMMICLFICHTSCYLGKSATTREDVECIGSWWSYGGFDL